jgi:4-hydroxy-tetrahydrodipicolinate reductase
MTPVRVVICGAGGRMGRALAESLDAEAGLVLHAALDAPGTPAIGTPVASGGATVTIGSDVVAALSGADALIDFTRPEGTLTHLAACIDAGVGCVIGTTGFGPEQKARIGAAATRIPIVMAPNMSVGVNVLVDLVGRAARALGDAYDVEVIEAHHRHKVDAPSGTALRLGEAAAAALGRDLTDCAVYGRKGVTGERDRRTIGFATVRGGDVVGDHTVLFAGIGERVEITHRASSRTTFAQGALRAARFVQSRAPGLYDMRDVLGLGD